MNDKNDIDFASVVTSNVNVQCPHCDRSEEFADELTARAWITGHIQEVHRDELPAYD